eukprot:m.38033 g.38033  ORF g.38033 m.38033 type:complete len:57 (-) comp11146_c0_seq2:1232-1402(-)
MHPGTPYCCSGRVWFSAASASMSLSEGRFGEADSAMISMAFEPADDDAVASLDAAV